MDYFLKPGKCVCATRFQEYHLLKMDLEVNLSVHYLVTFMKE